MPEMQHMVLKSRGSVIPPTDVSEERSALGACLLGQASDAMRLLRSDDFCLSSHREIFDAICALLCRGERALEVSLVTAELQKRGTLEVVGGEAYLADLDFGVVPERKMESRALLLRELADRRKVLRVSEEAIRKATDLHQPIAQVKVWIRESMR